MRTEIILLVRRRVFSALNGQGIGRRPYDEMYSRAHSDISAVETLLIQQRFLFGEAQSAADVSIGCVLASL